MKRWFIIGSLMAVALLAVSAYALQGKVFSQEPAAQVSENVQTADCSGCAGSSGCASVSGGCLSAGSSPEAARSRIERIEAYLFDYYANKQGLSDITVEVESFGCHEEATVKQAGKVLAKFSISGGNINKIEA